MSYDDATRVLQDAPAGRLVALQGGSNTQIMTLPMKNGQSAIYGEYGGIAGLIYILAKRKFAVPFPAPQCRWQSRRGRHVPRPNGEQCLEAWSAPQYC